MPRFLFPLLLSGLLATVPAPAFAANASCEATAAAKHLAGAAKTSFMKKCEKDTAAPAAAAAATPQCAARAAEKKLSGAAKNSFMKKCEKDAAAKP